MSNLASVQLALPRLSGHPVSRGAETPIVQRLATHMDIAWDVDGTLLDHPASPLLHRFIMQTPHIRHVIVTFRGERQDSFWSRLGRYSTALGPAAFHRVIYMPESLAAGLIEDRRASKQTGWPRLGRLWRGRKQEIENPHLTWKGETCGREGITALVDDMTGLVAKGCQRHGVELFHPGAFLKVQKASALQH